MRFYLKAGFTRVAPTDYCPSMDCIIKPSPAIDLYDTRATMSSSPYEMMAVG